MPKPKRQSRIKEDFFTKVMECKFPIPTFDIDADSPIICPKCGRDL